MVSEQIPALAAAPPKGSSSTPKSVLWGSAHGLKVPGFVLLPPTRTLDVPREPRARQGSAPRHACRVLCLSSASLSDLGALHTRHGSGALSCLQPGATALPARGEAGSAPQSAQTHGVPCACPLAAGPRTGCSSRCFLQRRRGERRVRAGCHTPVSEAVRAARGLALAPGHSRAAVPAPGAASLEGCHLHGRLWHKGGHPPPWHRGQGCSTDLCRPRNRGIVTPTHTARAPLPRAPVPDPQGFKSPRGGGCIGPQCPA